MTKTVRKPAPKAPERPLPATVPAPAAGPSICRWLALAAVAALLPAILLYLPSTMNPLVWDDELHVPLATSGGVTNTFGTAAGEYRRPLVLLSYAAQAGLGFGSPAALHAANAVLHGINAALVVLLVGATLPASISAGSAALVALAAGLVFASHPVVSGSVAYVSGRTDLVASFFLLVAVAANAPGRPAPAPPAGRAGSWLRAAVATAAVVAAGLSKESGLVAGPLVAAMLWWRRSRGDSTITATRLALPLAATAATAALVMPSAAASSVPVALRLRGAATALATYAELLVWPHDLHLDRLTPLAPEAAAAVGAAAVTAATVTVVRFLRKPSRTLLAVVAFVLLVAPGSGLVPVYPAIADRYVFTGEQFLYAPLIVIAAALAIVVARAFDLVLPRIVPAPVRERLRQRLVPPPDAAGAQPFVASPGAFGSMLVAMTLTLAWMPVVLGRQAEFTSAEQVYRKTLAHSPSPRACFNLGNLHLARREYADALDVYRRCVAIAPRDAAAHGQLAVALQQLGRTDEARRAYGHSLVLDDRNARVWSNFATLDANAGRLDDARAKWRRALEIDPGESTATAGLRRLDEAAHGAAAPR